MRPKVVIVAGPTASGKTSVALELARRSRVAVVSADSIQVYRFLDIGSAKPSRFLNEREFPITCWTLDILMKTSERETTSGKLDRAI